MNTATEAKN
jgi:hypothetical protein